MAATGVAGEHLVSFVQAGGLVSVVKRAFSGMLVLVAAVFCRSGLEERQGCSTYRMDELL